MCPRVGSVDAFQQMVEQRRDRHGTDCANYFKYRVHSWKIRLLNKSALISINKALVCLNSPQPDQARDGSPNSSGSLAICSKTVN
jgi:hypothetical protein